jgi:hypothetical protein
MIKTATLLALMACTAFATVDNHAEINKGIEAKNDQRTFLAIISNEMSQNKYPTQSGLKTKTTHMPKVYLEYIGSEHFGFSLSHKMNLSNTRYEDHLEGDVSSSYNAQELGLFGKYAGQVWSTVTGIRGKTTQYKLHAAGQEVDADLGGFSLTLFSDNAFKVNPCFSVLAGAFVSKNPRNNMAAGFDLGTAIKLSSGSPLSVIPMIHYERSTNRKDSSLKLDTKSASLKVAYDLTKDVSLFGKPYISHNKTFGSQKGFLVGVSAKL